ncbi:hypothetical protein [Pseudalkalibacillus hwajinpoensis]|uniref:hypothetical protein n=1 Tax=Guptibacillus hwajinpoensis TaxID=208199 RepID=UPI001CD66235|nr:hypothetical protein [Pseudalkalibacillus hwajinpoensis]MCA0992754.1 hypothetical protein [Pseudalkalibacillus hwajinpoensis]
MSNDRRSTDVKHSIAGFYFQLLIACKELVTMSKHYPKGYVGVEYGADIRVNKGNDRYIEAKFYKQNYFTRYSEAIRHTIYNFYHTHRDSNSLNGTFVINSNVPISNSDKKFFNDWNNQEFSCRTDFINYVKDCLVYEYIGKDAFSEKYKTFKETYQKNHPHIKKPKYKSALIKQLHENLEEYDLYIPNEVLMKDEEIFDFIKQVSFELPEEKVEKYDSIIQLNNTIEKSLEELFPGNSQYSSIRYLIMNAFLNTTASSNNHVLYVNDLEDIVSDHEESVSALFESDSLVKTMKEIEEELIKYERKLKKSGFSSQLEHILLVLGVCTEQWIEDIRLHGEKKINNRFIMSAEHTYTLNILDLFKAMAEISSMAEISLGDVNLKKLEGINNIGFSEYQQFSLRTTPSSSDREDEETLITSFIEHSLKEQEYLKAMGDETIIFENACEICKYDKKAIEEDIVLDIARPYGGLAQQGLFQSFDYKCTSCLKLNTHDDECQFANNFKKGK